LRAEAHSIVPFQRLELIANGVVIAGKDASSLTAAALESEFLAPGSCWLAARCYGNGALPGGLYTQCVYAHTAPVYVQVASQPFRPDMGAIASLLQELDRMLEWADREGCCADQQRRDHLAAIFQSARQEL